MRALPTSCLLLTLCWATPLVAQIAPPPTNEERAARHYARGYELTEAQDYASAAAEFERAYQASPHYSVLYNLGQAYVLGGKQADGVRALRRFLAEGGTAAPADLVARAHSALEQSQRRVGRLRLRLSAPVDASVVIDGTTVSRAALSEDYLLDSGPHGIWLTAAGHQGKHEAFSLAAGELLELAVQLEPLPRRRIPARKIAENATLPARDDGSGHSLRAWSYVLGASSVAFAVTAVALVVDNNADNDAWRTRRDRFLRSSHQGITTNLQRGELAALTAEATRQQRVDDVALGLGLAAAMSLGGGAYLFWLSTAETAPKDRFAFDGQTLAWSRTW